MKRPRLILPIPPAVIEAVKVWETRNQLPILPPEPAKEGSRGEPALDRRDPAYQAIAFLVSKRCTVRDILCLLKLLYAYGLTAGFESQKRKREKWIDRAKNLVLRLRRDANDAETLLRTLISIPTPLPAPMKQSGAPRKTPAETKKPGHPYYDTGLPDVWDVMRTSASDLEAYIRNVKDQDFPLDEIYKRKWAGTTHFLVAAAALIEEATGKPHFEQLETLLEQIWPNKIVRKPKMQKKPRKDGEEEKSEIGQAVQRKVNGFKTRNPEFVLEYLQPDPAVGKKEEKTVREKISELLS